VALAGPVAGDLDPSFSRDGKVVTDFRYRLGTPKSTYWPRANAVAVDSRDRVVAVGAADRRFAVARYLPNGRLDRSFSGNGKLKTDVGHGRSRAYGAVIDSRGRIIAAGLGSAHDGEDRTALVRYEPGGHIDESFGKHGIVRTDIGGGFSWARGITIDGTGRLVVAGIAADHFGLARYMPNGNLDRSFGDDGKVVTAFSEDPGIDQAYSVAVDSHGRVVAGGYTQPSRFNVPRAHRLDFALARYRPDGTLDPSFGLDGKVTTDLGYRDAVSSIAIDTRDRIVAAGEAGRPQQDFLRLALARYLVDGSLDGSFGDSGRVLTGFKGRSIAAGVAIDFRHRILAAGRVSRSGLRAFALARYLGDGSLDPRFSGNGTVTTRFGDGRRVQGASGVAIDSRERIVAAGYAGPHFAVARYDGRGR
jgi:uncharacterized delta-60 repeat protein